MGSIMQAPKTIATNSFVTEIYMNSARTMLPLFTARGALYEIQFVDGATVCVRCERFGFSWTSASESATDEHKSAAIGSMFQLSANLFQTAAATAMRSALQSIGA